MQERKDALQQKDIIERSYSTAADFRIVGYFIRFPSNLSGLRILDIGAGASPAVLELNRRGARAIAYDVRYGNLDRLKESVERFITDPSYSARQENEAKVEKNLSDLKEDLPKGISSHLFDTAVQMTKSSMSQATVEYMNRQRRSLETFLDAAKKGGLPCVGGSATQLPFKDKSFDFIYSLQAMSQFLLEDREVFMQSINEALRVLKINGELQLHPWAPNPYELKQSPQRQSMVALMRLLREKKMPYRIEQFRDYSSPRIVISKR